MHVPTRLLRLLGASTLLGAITLSAASADEVNTRPRPHILNPHLRVCDMPFPRPEANTENGLVRMPFCADLDQDGIPDRFDVDDDGNGVEDHAETDADGDGIMNSDEADTDGDGVYDDLEIVE